MSTHSDIRSTGQPPPAVALRDLIDGFRKTQLIHVAAKLRIADLLKEGPKNCDELAQLAGARSQALYRVLRALVSMGICAENEDGRFELTPLAAPLQTGVPGSLRAWAIMSGNEWHRSWGDLLHTVRTGEPAFEHVFGLEQWEYLARNPEAAETFNESMAEMMEHASAAIVAAYDFSRIATIVDVGGGHGSLIVAILKANPGLRGILFDRSYVVESAGNLLDGEGVAGCCQLVAGDFFRSVPGRGDAHILKWIIHDWDDDRAVAILKNCRRALPPNGRLLVVERVIPPGNEPFEGKMGDIMMLVLGGGLERNEAEYEALLAAAGFAMTKIVPTASPFSIIEGVPV